MRTGCRGNGSFKREFIESLRQRFGKRSFTYHEAKTLYEFDRRVFFSLLSDGYLKNYSEGGKKVRKGTKSLYVMNDEESNHRQGYSGHIDPRSHSVSLKKEMLSKIEPILS